MLAKKNDETTKRTTAFFRLVFVIIMDAFDADVRTGEGTRKPVDIGGATVAVLKDAAAGGNGGTPPGKTRTMLPSAADSQLPTVIVLLQPLLLTGSPPAPCPRLEVLASETPTSLRVWLRRALNLGASDKIYLYISTGGRRMSPSPDECLGSLAACLNNENPNIPLIIGYSTRPIANV